MSTDVNEILHKLVENAAVMVLYLDQDGNVVLCNKKTESVHGFSNNKSNGSKIVKLF